MRKSGEGGDNQSLLFVGLYLGSVGSRFGGGNTTTAARHRYHLRYPPNVIKISNITQIFSLEILTKNEITLVGAKRHLPESDIIYKICKEQLPIRNFTDYLTPNIMCVFNIMPDCFFFLSFFLILKFILCIY